MMGRLPWTLCSILTWMVANSLASKGCPHPPVPAAATYVNVTGGLGEDEWHVRYVCNIGTSQPGTKYHQAAALSSSQLTFDSWEQHGKARVALQGQKRGWRRVGQWALEAPLPKNRGRQLSPDGRPLSGQSTLLCQPAWSGSACRSAWFAFAVITG